jgi:hypothetical protein
MTSPSNLTHTSSPILSFPDISFEYTNQRVPLGFTLDNGVKDDSTVMIFDSLQLDNVFTVTAPWTLTFAFPFGFNGVQALRYELTHAHEWNIFGVAHNSLVRIAPFPRHLFIFQV